MIRSIIALCVGLVCQASSAHATVFDPHAQVIACSDPVVAKQLANRYIGEGGLVGLFPLSLAGAITQKICRYAHPTETLLKEVGVSGRDVLSLPKRAGDRGFKGGAIALVVALPREVAVRLGLMRLPEQHASVSILILGYGKRRINA